MCFIQDGSLYIDKLYEVKFHLINAKVLVYLVNQL